MGAAVRRCSPWQAASTWCPTWSGSLLTSTQTCEPLPKHAPPFPTPPTRCRRPGRTSPGPRWSAGPAARPANAACRLPSPWASPALTREGMRSRMRACQLRFRQCSMPAAISTGVSSTDGGVEGRGEGGGRGAVAQVGLRASATAPAAAHSAPPFPPHVGRRNQQAVGKGKATPDREASHQSRRSRPLWSGRASCPPAAPAACRAPPAPPRLAAGPACS